MIKSLLGLALALSLFPITALADDENGPANLSPAQRQAMHQTFQRFMSQEEQLHQQMRLQALNSLTPVHRRAVAAAIGDLAIAANPDPMTTARRIDAMLSPGERQRVISAHNSFRTQSMQLHDQMRNELRSEMPADMQSHFANHDNESKEKQEAMSRMQNDAGAILLHILSPHGMMGDHGGMMMHMEGQPPH
jgi:hypothetical protein